MRSSKNICVDPNGPQQNKIDMVTYVPNGISEMMAPPNPRTDERTADGRTDGRTTDGRTDDGRTDGWICLIKT